MKKIFGIFFVLIAFVNSSVLADTFENAVVISSIYQYDQTDFPGVSGKSGIQTAASVQQDPPTDSVSVSSTPTGNNVNLPYSSGYKIFFKIYNSPPMGPDLILLIIL